MPRERAVLRVGRLCIASRMTFTTDDQLDLAWAATLIPAVTRNAINADYHVRPGHSRTLMRQIRPLARTDYARGHLDLLAVLTTTPDVGETAWQQRFDELRAYSDTYFPIVIVRKDSDRIVACGTVMLERKFIRGNGLVGHIEDIATAKECQGKGLGKRIIEALTAVAFARGACA